MKEKLYDRSEAVAALNRVEGFNPMELARTLTKEGQEGQLYLDVKYRKLWFRLVHPLGKIVSSIRSFTENMAIVEARIYLDKCDAEENYIANAFSQRFRTNDPNFGDKFLEMAETAAVGRALSDAGFGLQFADVGEENDPMQVDAGIQIPGMAAQSQVQGNDIPQGGMTWNPQMQSDMLGNNTPPINQGGQNPQPAMTGNQNPQHIMTANQGTQAVPQNQDGQSQSMPQGTANPQSSESAQSNPMMNQFYQQAQEKGTTIGQNSVGAPQMQNSFGNQNQQAGQMPQMQGNSQSSSQYSPATSLDESLPVEELVQRMTYEQATQVVINGNGKFGGKTMGQVAVESPKNLEWFAQSYSGKNHLIPAAARVLLNAAMPMAG
ncbi:hypothetical protein EBB54_24050 [Schaedlerella arabinosiphila]|uniref:Uncharacterized protein n=1 Tax=Schaedlerella arabinosiphila TaxID=2044587 RepID=A0A3R8JSN7_9FIRM|nr:hypothetical protein [Schaedlerella arabinosiphila]RRK34075.1 hypothetical protein EBB54_24050 [Schaedlerella arabinosiphila]